MAHSGTLTAYCQAEIARLQAEIAELQRQIIARQGGIAAYEDVLQELAKEETNGLDSATDVGG